MARRLMRGVFRPAARTTLAWILTKTVMQMSVFWLLFLAVIPSAIIRLEAVMGWVSFASQAIRFTGWALFAAAGTLGVASAYCMARDGRGTPMPIDGSTRLVTRGPYAYVRNPMAIAGLTQGAAVGLILGSWGVLSYVLCGVLLWDRLVRPIEEDHLQDTFGERFTSYRSAVACWWPRMTPWSG